MDELDAVWSQTDVHLVVRLAVAAGIGFLIGIEREFAKRVRDTAGVEGGTFQKQFAGLRTFTLIALLGFLAAFSARSLGLWFFGLTLAGFLALVIASYLSSIRRGDIGATSEVTAMITFLLGGLAYEGHLLFIIIVAVLVVLLLSFKLPLHRFVTRLTEQEVRAIVEFVVISVLVLPFLPNAGYGPLAAWNPKEIWTMVVLVSGLSLVGYLLSKAIGGNRGMRVSGLLGGLVSSTAVALGLGQRARQDPGMTTSLAVGIVAASAVMFPRMLVIVAFVNQRLALLMALPLGLMAVAGFVAARYMRDPDPNTAASPALLTNPLNLRVALQFAVLYALVRWLVVWADDRFGHGGAYLAGALAGITDVDAVTLSMARMAEQASWERTAIITIILSALVNTAVKYVIVLVVGIPALRRQVAPGFLAMGVASLLGIVWAALR